LLFDSKLEISADGVCGVDEESEEDI
jgi:hypothetical protein